MVRILRVYAARVLIQRHHLSLSRRSFVQCSVDVITRGMRRYPQNPKSVLFACTDSKSVWVMLFCYLGNTRINEEWDGRWAWIKGGVVVG